MESNKIKFTSFDDFNLNRYLGKWFEIARIRNDFQPNMIDCSAEYILNEKGYIDIINRGYVNNKLVSIKGKAIKTKRNNEFRVSFFLYNYSTYKILAIDENYKYSLVGGDSDDYLWILSRSTYIPDDVYNYFIKLAKEKGYNINKLNKY